ncbi:S41 family peptidase [Roseisolibacter agri]|uniref:Tricorn protease homolog n=1 Tax=Roseisolibacter agri TaxID=2014610 RepID=A0AA37V056_9BACT|nr:S41 family peptidase [Roseisolibacter agri]GLC23800.1 tricorn protease [Roseisolibacter agri]
MVTGVLSRAATLLVLAATPALAQDPLWLRYPAISPDGRTIAFAYRGDVWTVPTGGGVAAPLTIDPAHDYHPVWSRDGKWIAFASDRSGNFDVYVMPATGGAARRLTQHSADDVPTDFTPDGSAVTFVSSRMHAQASAAFPAATLPDLYRVPVAGGRETMLLPTAAEAARWSHDGRRLAFHDRKGYEDPWRKHHTSSVTRDVWVVDRASNTYTNLTARAGEDRNPVWGPGDSTLFYLSEADGTSNVYRLSLRDPSRPAQVTRQTRHPVRFLSSSDAGDLAFSWNGELYTLPAGTDAPRKVAVQIRAEMRQQSTQNARMDGAVTELALAPGGKEIALVARGEVFVTSADYGTTKRITSTPGQERSVSFSPDGRCVLYAAERGARWQVLRSCLDRGDEHALSRGTLLKEEVLVSGDFEAFQPSFSPDGKEVAYLENRTALKVLNLATRRTRTVLEPKWNYSYSDGDQWYEWSPDGRWFLVQYFATPRWVGEVGLVDAAGGTPPVNVTQSGYEDAHPRWMMGGKMLLWYSNRLGMRGAAGGGGTQSDVFGALLTREAWDRFNLSKEELEALEEAEKRARSDTAAARIAKGMKDDAKRTPTVAPTLRLELDRIEDRTKRLTIHSSELADAVLTPTGDRLVYLSKFEKGYDLWAHDLRAGETKLLAKLGAEEAGSLAIDSAGAFAYFLADRKPVKIKLADGARSAIAMRPEMVLDPVGERAFEFEHAWRQVREKFYDTTLHGVDWNGYREAYARFLPDIADDFDFAEMVSEMLGELNASHTGMRYRPTNPAADVTASIGAFLDDAWTGAGLRIAEVIAKGPLDRAGSRVAAGTILEAVDGVPLTPERDLAALLNRKADQPVRLALRDASGATRWEEVVKPIAPPALNELLYQRWVKSRREAVARLSGGRVGYVHVRGMNDASYRDVFAEALGRNAGREALVVDTRFNGGGWLHDDLATFLGGQRYLRYVPRGQQVGVEPGDKWVGPSVVLMSEGNYSDAHMFPYTYRHLGLGKLVGMPVPGTGTAVWWERLQNPALVFGIPEVGSLGEDGKFLENLQIEPDILVRNDPTRLAAGEDQQLEAAVKELLRQLETAPKAKAAVSTSR